MVTDPFLVAEIVRQSDLYDKNDQLVLAKPINEVRDWTLVWQASTAFDFLG